MRRVKLLGCIAAAPLLIGAAQPVHLQPSSRWILDYAENSCRLIRSFGEGDLKTTVIFESDAPDDMDMVLVGRPLSSDLAEIPAKFLPHQETTAKGRHVTSKGEPGVLFPMVRLLPQAEVVKIEAEQNERKRTPQIRPRPLDLAEKLRRRTERLEFAEAATELEVDTRAGRAVILETGSLGSPIKAFDQCSRDSLRDWGVNPDVEDKIVRPVWMPNLRDLIRGDDYPRNMLFAGQQSVVNVRVLVDAAGHVTKCTSISDFQLKDFNELVCAKITSKAHFEPAELSDGTKVPSYYTETIIFRIAE